jgi:hypothetical protein
LKALNIPTYQQLGLNISLHLPQELGGRRSRHQSAHLNREDITLFPLLYNKYGKSTAEEKVITVILFYFLNL